MKLAIFGTGYVGLVTGTCFAEMGNDVLCVDVDADKVASLERGEVTIFEPGLDAMVTSNVARGSLRFTTNAQEGVEFAEIIFIAVGTPEDEDGSADLQYVLNVAGSIGEHMNSLKIVVDKSTVPVGTGDKVEAKIAERLADRGVEVPFHVASNPEFLKEGAAVADFMKPDRIVVGSDSKVAAHYMDQLYAPFNRNHDKVVHMDRRSAELTKYAANVMLATRISLMNELANLADRLDADIESVRRGVGMDPRIGYHFIYAGTGYGGSCFPKDVKALIHTASEVDYDAHIMAGVEAVNAAQKRVLFDKLINHFDGDINGKCFALWGLAFKPNTDDMREAPSQTLIELLTGAGARVQGYDPEANDAAERLFAKNALFSTAPDRRAALKGSDGLILVTEWNEFRSPDFQEIKNELSEPVIFDGRNLYEPDFLNQLGFTHYGIGRGS
ncbi:MAG: nucleotide sugar dehydrogenase [Pseudomonadales bacterium]|nr:nucleotide sugar dehydrogenase [Pseudomonadales bacterium]